MIGQSINPSDPPNPFKTFPNPSENLPGNFFRTLKEREIGRD